MNKRRPGVTNHVTGVSLLLKGTIQHSLAEKWKDTCKFSHLEWICVNDISNQMIAHYICDGCLSKLWRMHAKSPIRNLLRPKLGARYASRHVSLSNSRAITGGISPLFFYSNDRWTHSGATVPPIPSNLRETSATHPIPAPLPDETSLVYPPPNVVYKPNPPMTLVRTAQYLYIPIKIPSNDSSCVDRHVRIRALPLPWICPLYCFLQQSEQLSVRPPRTRSTRFKKSLMTLNGPNPFETARATDHHTLPRLPTSASFQGLLE